MRDDLEAHRLHDAGMKYIAVTLFVLAALAPAVLAYGLEGAAGLFVYGAVLVAFLGGFAIYLAWARL